MVLLALRIRAEFKNIWKLEPQGGVNDRDFGYLLKVKCVNCREIGKKEVCLSYNEAVLEGARKFVHLQKKCTFCGSQGTIKMLLGRGCPLTNILTEAGDSACLMVFDCSGYEPIHFSFTAGWRVQSIAGTEFENVDLSPGEFVAFDKYAQAPVEISKLSSTFAVVRF
ncbi:hypothetical protein M0R45_011785 [Rubus argutus]|uniref:CXXC motif containing zinc binding protein n=1 Tax=Rubus argutus TaxID=59490 RepID=A0AAW1YE07_RUBAR